LGIFNAIFPIAASLLIGWICANFWIKDKQLWEGLNKLVYYIMFPALIVYKVANADVADLDKSFVIILIILVFTLIALLWIFQFLFESKIFWVTFVQGAFRYNSYVFIGVTMFYVGDSAIPTIALITGTMIFFATVIGVVMLSVYSSKHANLKSILSSVISNPLILACILGGLVNKASLYFPEILKIDSINSTLDNFGSASLVVSLITIGSGINLKLNGKKLLATVNCSIVKLLIFPLMVVVALKYFNYDSDLILICMLFAASPGSPSASAMVKILNGDYEAINNMIGMQTVLSMITIPLLLVAFPYI
jgi:malonate transporter